MPRKHTQNVNNDDKDKTSERLISKKKLLAAAAAAAAAALTGAVAATSKNDSTNAPNLRGDISNANINNHQDMTDNKTTERGYNSNVVTTTPNDLSNYIISDFGTRALNTASSINTQMFTIAEEVYELIKEIDAELQKQFDAVQIAIAKAVISGIQPAVDMLGYIARQLQTDIIKCQGTLAVCADVSNSVKINDAAEQGIQLDIDLVPYLNIAANGTTPVYYAFGDYVQQVGPSDNPQVIITGLPTITIQGDATYLNPALEQLLSDLRTGVLTTPTAGRPLTIQIGATDGFFDDPQKCEATLTDILTEYPYTRVVFLYIENGYNKINNSTDFDPYDQYDENSATVGVALSWLFNKGGVLNNDGVQRIYNGLEYPSTEAAIADDVNIANILCYNPWLAITNAPSSAPTTGVEGGLPPEAEAAAICGALLPLCIPWWLPLLRKRQNFLPVDADEHGPALDLLGRTANQTATAAATADYEADLAAWEQEHREHDLAHAAAVREAGAQLPEYVVEGPVERTGHGGFDLGLGGSGVPGVPFINSGIRTHGGKRKTVTQLTPVLPPPLRERPQPPAHIEPNMVNSLYVGDSTPFSWWPITITKGILDNWMKLEIANAELGKERLEFNLKGLGRNATAKAAEVPPGTVIWLAEKTGQGLDGILRWISFSRAKRMLKPGDVVQFDAKTGAIINIARRTDPNDPNSVKLIPVISNINNSKMRVPPGATTTTPTPFSSVTAQTGDGDPESLNPVFQAFLEGLQSRPSSPILERPSSSH